MRFRTIANGLYETVEITGAGGRYRVTLGDRTVDLDARCPAPGLYSILLDGASYVVAVQHEDGAYVVDVRGESYVIQVDEETRAKIRAGAGAATAGRHIVKAPMPGKITHVSVRVRDAVQAGDSLVVIEAMKMENELKAASSGTVQEVRVDVGQPVN